MKLSIIIPTLNEARQLPASLAALAPLRDAGVEVIVVDGGSEDETVSLAQSDADAVIVAPRGRAAQMNAGADMASGDILLFLHADTVLPPDAYEAIDAGLATNRHWWGRFDVDIVGDSPLLHVVAWFMNRRSRLSCVATGDQAIFVRRSAFDAVGGFPDQPLMEDVELSKRLRRFSAPLCIASPVRTSGRRWEKHGVWRTIFLMWRLRWSYWWGVPAATLAKEYR